MPVVLQPLLPSTEGLPVVPVHVFAPVEILYVKVAYLSGSADVATITPLEAQAVALAVAPVC